MRVPAVPAIYRTTVRHHREEPVRHGFDQRSVSWLVDLDDLPSYGPLARFEPRDHLGPQGGSVRERFDAFLEGEGVDLDGGRVLMLASPRVLGYCFNPLTLFWGFDPAGDLRAVVLEVHNTYGERHPYLVATDERGRGRTDKAFYVSPFNDVDGHYTVHVPVPDERLSLNVTLHRDGRAPFTASVRGHGVPATTAQVLRTSLRHPLEPLAVRARIQWHGITLLVRGLRIRPRPRHREETAP